MHSISIAMGTYNGASYLRDQLDSLLNQVHPPEELVVCDDGSTDQTIKIIEEFSKRAPFPVRIYRNERNLGYAKNFLKAARLCQGDWIAFCDQDDVWLPNKISETVSAICQTVDCNLILQNALLCDSELSSSGRKFPKKLNAGTYGRAEQYGFWVWLGFLQTVRREIINLWDNGSLLRNYFPHHSEISHDKWTCMVANALGGIVVLDEPAALYRRHAGALTGDYDHQSFRERISKAKHVSSDHYYFLSEVADECADYMRRLATRTDNVTWASAFSDNAQHFSQLSKIQSLRGRLYASPRFRERLTTCVRIAGMGGYVGQPFQAMGMRSAAKDLIRVSTGSRL